MTHSKPVIKKGSNKWIMIFEQGYIRSVTWRNCIACLNPVGCQSCLFGVLNCPSGSRLLLNNCMIVECPGVDVWDKSYPELKKRLHLKGYEQINYYIIRILYSPKDTVVTAIRAHANHQIEFQMCFLSNVIFLISLENW